MYIGTGESYVSGDVNGNGVWKSTDGGNSWFHVFGGAEGETILKTDSEVIINTPSSIADSYTALSASFGPKATTNITENLVLVNAGGTTPTEACTELLNFEELNGKIALINRGNCDFISKVLFAQEAGAIAVIMINNEPGNPITMGGDDLTGAVKIPSVMVSQEAGTAFVAQINAGQTVNATITAGSGEFSGFYVLEGNQHVNDITIRNNNGVSEVYIAAGTTFYSDASPSALLGPGDYGVYKSTNAGASWSLLGLPLTPAGNRYEPNDIEISADNTIWVATKNNQITGDGGGTIFASTDGNAFILKHQLAGLRTQIAASPTDANKIYVLAQGSVVPVIIQKTTDAFATTTDLPLPDDVGPGIDADDFTRGQAFYDLVIKLDPTNDEKVYVGGIDLFSSADGGNVWDQLSHWYGYDGLPDVHADQHAIVFGNGDSSKMLYGNDGGVYYSSTSGTNATARNNGYNVTQFYYVGVAPVNETNTGDYFAAGAQDNGTQFFGNATEGINPSEEIYGGDGAYTAFDKDGVDTYVISNYVYNNAITKYDYVTGVYTTISNSGDDIGEFINPQVLDSRLDFLYSNYSVTDDYKIKIYRTNVTSGFDAATLSNDLLDSPALALAVSPFYDSNTAGEVYLGLENGKLLKVENATSAFGKRWTELTGAGFVGSISDISFGQTANDIFVTFHNYGVNNVWYSNDGGATWSPKDGDLPDMPVKTILQNPLKIDEVVIGTELGVWYTEDFSSDSPTWKSAFNGMSNVKVLDFDLRNDNTIYAATYGRGVFSGKFTGDALSVEDNVLASGISLYPTISNGEFKINSKSNLGEVNLQIFNISGQTVYVKNLNLNGNTPNDIKINVASGVYLAKFTEGAITTTKKFIIK